MLLSVKTIRYSSLRSLLKVRSCECSRLTIHHLGLNDIPKITLTDIRKLLRQKGFAVQDGYTSLTTRCVMCSGDPKNAEGKLFVNKTTGYFVCPKCNIHGDWGILERLIKKAKVEPTLKDLIENSRKCTAQFDKDWQVIMDSTTSIDKLSETEVLELLRLFEYPFNTEASKALSEVRVSTDRTILYFPLKNSLNHIIGYRKIQAGKEDEIENFGLHTGGLFSCRAPKVGRSDQAILVPSIQDVLNLAAQKVSGTLVWLSNCSLPPVVLPTLENYQKLCLWGDWDNMRAAAEKLGEERCRFVRPTDGLVTASEAAAANLSLKTLVSEAKPAAHRSITTFAALRDDVYAELTNIEKVRGVKWKRFPSLTKILGGHRRGELTVLTGPTGCGKTTLCAEMSLDLAQQGVTTLWGSFEIRNSRLAKTMLQQFAGVPLEHNLQDFHTYANEFQKLPVYYLAFHGQQSIKVVMESWTTCSSCSVWARSVTATAMYARTPSLQHFEPSPPRGIAMSRLLCTPGRSETRKIYRRVQYSAVPRRRKKPITSL
ncbi:twinkle protein, mitochondrial isoform X2 [Hyposmocoma kahamanoa]|uniref:twinkle protein, mitochondrial isoform X2 n=1 Tax=Hyposmocoma kahamanoa TaxID=1477025 RepID=UPI000E6D93D3|nr:twinkle protein, mitochondrial isoform X2 [Hyposmocoma kahamanoa]XP_026323782.1 twinkle protein, mitochondrial isoform X2 [Hyposmocoma kahamanoa]